MIKDYRITSKLREDSKYEVFKALHEEGQNAVILKTFKATHPSPKAIGHLNAEFEILKSLAHPNIIKAKNIQTTEHSIVLVLEDVAKSSLSDQIQHAALSLTNFFKVAFPLVDAVKYLHSQRIIHKNINPNEIFLNNNYQEVKLAGFSFASAFGREAQEANVNEAFEAGLTYVSPEQTGRMNRAVDHRTDLYSLGLSRLKTR
jgi:serine/threonine protein kinase